MLHEHVHDARGLGTAVEDVADDVEPVHGEALYELCERSYYAVCGAGGYDAVEYGVVIAVLIRVLVALDVQQLVEHELPVGRHLAAHIAAGVLARERLSQQAELLEYLAQAGVVQLAALAQAGKLLYGVVDDGTERAALRLALRVLKEPADLLEYYAGAVVEYVPHRAVLAVQVAYEVLRALGQGEDGAEVYYLGAHGRLIRVFFGQKLQVFA